MRSHFMDKRANTAIYPLLLVSHCATYKNAHNDYNNCNFMNIRITPDLQLSSNALNSDIFTHPAFRQVLAREFRLQAVQVSLESYPTLPAFLKMPWWGKQTLILGAGFDKTGIIPPIESSNYGLFIEELAQALRTTPIHQLKIRTKHHIPCLTDEADKVELAVDIPSASAVWDNLSTNTRKNIRRALKRGLQAQIGNSDALLAAFYPLYYHSLHEIGSLPHSQAFFSELLTQCREQIVIFVGFMDDIPVVASLNFVSDTEIYGAWSGTHAAYKKHNVFLTMLWQLVEYCAAQGKHTYNLGRSSEGSNPHQFKLKLANRSQKIYYYRLPIKPLTQRKATLQQTAAWLIRHTPPLVMEGLSRTLLHRFY